MEWVVGDYRQYENSETVFCRFGVGQIWAIESHVQHRNTRWPFRLQQFVTIDAGNNTPAPRIGILTAGRHGYSVAAYP